MPDESSPSLLMFKWRVSIRTAYVMLGIIVLVAGCSMLGTLSDTSASESFRFIGLLVLFMTAMAITATIFSGLQLSDKTEAFGLPSGSIRALLSIGIIILFVVFGLQLTSPREDDCRPGCPPAGGGKERAQGELVTVPYDKMESAIATYTAQKFVVIVRKYGKPQPIAAPGAAQPPAPSTDSDGQLELREPDRFSERFEASKQLVTAIITLLTSVVSFYFGSRSVTDAIKPDAKSDGTASDLAIRRKELAARVDQLKTALTDRKQKITEAGTAPDSEVPEEATARRAAADTAQKRQSALEAELQSITNLLASVDQAIANVGGAAPADSRAVNEQAAKDGLVKLSDALKNAEAQLPAYDAEVAAYVAASAVG